MSFESRDKSNMKIKRIREYSSFFSFVAALAVLFCAEGAFPQTQMKKIPAGSFIRTDGKKITLSEFSIADTEVTRGLWDAVWDWSAGNGYDINPGYSTDAQRPIWLVSWYDCVKWCNALSQMQGLEPVYYTDSSKREVYKEGRLDLTADCVKWDAEGFCLPTEAQWEYACRAGTKTNYYWGDEVYSTWDGQDAPWREYVQGYFHRLIHTPQPVAQKRPNAFSLYDMSGNAGEWCWDRYDTSYPAKPLKDPKGAENGSRVRVIRGGSVALDHSYYHQSHFRGRVHAYHRIKTNGFRIASSDPRAKLEIAPDAAPSFELRMARNEMLCAAIENDTQRAADNLFYLVDLSAKGLEKASEYYVVGKYQQALDEYKRYLLEKYRDKHFSVRVDAVQKKSTLEEAMKWRPPLVYYHNYPFTNSRISAYHCGQWFTDAFAKSGEMKYLDHYFLLMDDFILNGLRQFHTLSDVGLGKQYRGIDFDSHWPQDWDMFAGLDSASMSEVMFERIVSIANNIKPEDAEKISSVSIANFMAFLAEVGMGGCLDNGKEEVSNQVKHISSVLVYFGKTFDEFRDAPQWLDIGQYRLEKTMTGGENTLPDGGDMEQAFNYNQTNVGAGNEMNELFEGMEKPDWVSDVEKSSLERVRFFAGIIMPTGTVPAVGEGAAYDRRWPQRYESWLEMVDSPLTGDVLSCLVRKDEPCREPAFTSIAFPYSGYYALRDGWSSQSLYLFLKSSRAVKRGHAHQDDNGIEIAAYGRHLISDGGGVPYAPRFLPDEQKKDHQWIVDYLHNSFGANTVLVDGAVQTEWKRNVAEKAFDRTDDQRFYTSPSFDFVEGIYNDGYEAIRQGPSGSQLDEYRKLYGGDEEKYGDFAVLAKAALAQAQIEKKQIDATHNRQVLFVKNCKLWVVRDIVDGGSNYTQLWHFPPPLPVDRKINTAAMHLSMPGFTSEQVILSDDTDRFYTADPEGANVEIYNFTASDVSYEKYFGDKYPHKGWRAALGWLPAVDVNAKWSGKEPLVTLINPVAAGAKSSVKNLADISDENISGFEAVLQDGIKVTYKTSAKHSKLSAGNISAVAASLLVVDAPDVKKGLVTDCKELIINGNRKEINTESFEFELNDAAFEVIGGIMTPDDFKWSDEGGSTAPVYEYR
jgi:formylglycine-generating enzyme required for sulfatase activity